MKDYSQGKIYKIEPTVEHDEGDIYIGSTTQKYLSQRIAKHKCKYKRLIDNKDQDQMTSFKLFEKYGLDNCKIILLETVDASNYNELAAREAYYIKTFKCVNKCIPLRTKKEYARDRKEHFQKIDTINIELNMEKIEQRKQKAKDYYNTYRIEKNEKIREIKKIYREKNKEIIKEKRRKHYEENKEIIKERKKERDITKNINYNI